MIRARTQSCWCATTSAAICRIMDLLELSTADLEANCASRPISKPRSNMPPQHLNEAQFWIPPSVAQHTDDVPREAGFGAADVVGRGPFK